MCKEAYRKLFSIEILKEGFEIRRMHSVHLTQDQGNEILEMRNLSENDMDEFYNRELQGGCCERASFSWEHWAKKRHWLMSSQTFIRLARLLFLRVRRFKRFTNSVPFRGEL